jgi:hypothetical protein
MNKTVIKKKKLPHVLYENQLTGTTFMGKTSNMAEFQKICNFAHKWECHSVCLG